MFHSKDGLFFFRLQPQGEVRIIKSTDGRLPDETNTAWAVTLTENEWASVVCSVSDAGENHARWMRARRFHGTDLPFGEHELKGAFQEDITAEQKEWMDAPAGPLVGPQAIRRIADAIKRPAPLIGAFYLIDNGQRSPITEELARAYITQHYGEAHKDFPQWDGANLSLGTNQCVLFEETKIKSST